MKWLTVAAVFGLVQAQSRSTSTSSSSSLFSSRESLLSTSSSSSSASPTASTVLANGLTIIQPYTGSTVNIKDRLNISWAINDPALQFPGRTLTFEFEDLRNGILTGKPINPPLGSVAISATNFTSAALNTLFTDGLPSGYNYTVRCMVQPGVYFFSPQFTLISNGPLPTLSFSSVGNIGVTSTATASDSASPSSSADSNRIHGNFYVYSNFLAVVLVLGGLC